MKNERITGHHRCPEKHQQTIKLVLFLLLSTCQFLSLYLLWRANDRCVHACIPSHFFFQAMRIKKEIMMMRILAHLHSFPLVFFFFFPLFFFFFLPPLLLFIRVKLLLDHRPLDLGVRLIIQA